MVVLSLLFYFLYLRLLNGQDNHINIHISTPQPTHSLLPRIISDSLKTNDSPQSKTLKSLRMSTTKQEAFSGALFIGLDYATRVSVLKKIALMQPREPQTPPN